MTRTQLQSRIAELETEVARLQAQIEELTPSTKNWLKHIAENPLFENEREFNDFQRILRQLKDADRELDPSPQLARLRRDHRALIAKIKALGHFKSNRAAAEYAHRNFTR